MISRHSDFEGPPCIRTDSFSICLLRETSPKRLGNAGHPLQIVVIFAMLLFFLLFCMGIGPWSWYDQKNHFLQTFTKRFLNGKKAGISYCNAIKFHFLSGYQIITNTTKGSQNKCYCIYKNHIVCSRGNLLGIDSPQQKNMEVPNMLEFEYFRTSGLSFSFSGWCTVKSPLEVTSPKPLGTPLPSWSMGFLFQVSCCKIALIQKCSYFWIAVMRNELLYSTNPKWNTWYIETSFQKITVPFPPYIPDSAPNVAR